MMALIPFFTLRRWRSCFGKNGIIEITIGQPPEKEKSVLQSQWDAGFCLHLEMVEKVALIVIINNVMIPNIFVMRLKRLV